MMADEKPLCLSSDEQLLADTEYLINLKKRREVRNSLVELALDPSMIFTRTLCEYKAPTDNDNICDVFTVVFRFHRQELQLVHWAIAREVTTCVRDSTLFRGETVGTQLVSNYMQTKGAGFIKDVLQPMICKVQNGDLSIEVDPLRMPDSEDPLQLLNNQRKLAACAEELFSTVEKNVYKFPNSVRALFQFSQQKVAEKFPNLAQQIIGGFFFLRFVCPALVTPERFGLTDPTRLLPAANRRTLILISKVLQNLSNDIQFGEKEQYMVFINRYITDNQRRMSRFISELCTEDNSGRPQPTEKSVTEKEYTSATKKLAKICGENRESLSAIFQSLPGATKEASIFEKFVQQYLVDISINAARQQAKEESSSPTLPLANSESSSPLSLSSSSSTSPLASSTSNATTTTTSTTSTTTATTSTTRDLPSVSFQHPTDAPAKSNKNKKKDRKEKEKEKRDKREGNSQGSEKIKSWSLNRTLKRPDPLKMLASTKERIDKKNQLHKELKGSFAEGKMTGLRSVMLKDSNSGSTTTVITNPVFNQTNPALKVTRQDFSASFSSYPSSSFDNISPSSSSLPSSSSITLVSKDRTGSIETNSHNNSTNSNNSNVHFTTTATATTNSADYKSLLDEELKVKEKLMNEVKVLKSILGEEKERKMHLERYVAVLQQQLRDAGITPKEPELRRSGSSIIAGPQHPQHNTTTTTTVLNLTGMHPQHATTTATASMGLMSPHFGQSIPTTASILSNSPPIAQRRVTSMPPIKGVTASGSVVPASVGGGSGGGGMEAMLHPALIADRMLAPHTGVPMREIDNNHNTTTTTTTSVICFVGSECVDWLVEQNLSRMEAIAVADKLLGMGFFKQHTCPQHPQHPQQEGRFTFADDNNTFYEPPHRK